MISNATPVQTLFNILKAPIGAANIFREVIDVDFDAMPDVAVLIREGRTSSRKFANGVCVVREADSNVLLMTLGTDVNSDGAHETAKNKIKNALTAAGLSYEEQLLGYDSETKRLQTVFYIRVIYYEQ